VRSFCERYSRCESASRRGVVHFVIPPGAKAPSELAA
jgi:hypothetical protein